MSFMEARPPENPKTLARAIDTPMAKALREEIRTLVNSEPFTIGTMKTIESVASHGRQLLSGQAELDAIVPDLMEDTGFIGNMSIGGIDGPENFGNRAIREMASLLPKILDRQPKPSPLALVNALAAARSQGLDDVAAGLEAELKLKLPSLSEDQEIAAKDAVDQYIDEVGKEIAS